MRLATLLWVNAATCLGTGAVFLAAPGAVARFLGAVPAMALVLLGIVLVLHGAHLALAGRRGPLPWQVWFFSLGDGLWVIATIAILADGTWITTAPGVAVASATAVVVGIMGALQVQLQACAERPVSRI